MTGSEVIFKAVLKAAHVALNNDEAKVRGKTVFRLFVDGAFNTSESPTPCGMSLSHGR